MMSLPRLPLVLLLRFLLQLHSSVPTSIIPSQHFRTKSCVLRFKDTIRTFDTKYQLVTTTHDIITFSSYRCTFTLLKTHPQPISGIIPVGDDKAFYCHHNNSLPHPLFQLTWADHSVNLDKFKEKTELQRSCRHDTTKKEAFLTDSGIVYSATVEQNSNNFAIITKYDLQDGFWSSVNLEFCVQEFITMFIYGDFLYVIYKDSEGKAGVVRLCRNPPSRHTYIGTYKYSKLQCSLPDEVNFDLAVDAKHISGTLFLLTSKHPASLSGRVLCSFSIQDIDAILDEGIFRYFDVYGSTQEKQGSLTECGTGREKAFVEILHELRDPISSSSPIIQYPGSLTSFDIYRLSLGEELVYFTHGETVDIWRFKEGSSKLIQRLYTGKLITKLEVSEDKLFITAGRELLIAPALWCEHVQDAYKCYDEDNFYCAWDPKTWQCKDVKFCKSCVARSFYTSFTDDFPNGVSRQEVKGCHVHIMTYKPNDEYTDEYEPIRCVTSQRSNGTELVSFNQTCGGKIVMRCKAGTALRSGHLTRTCQSNGTWSGARPYCKEVKCNPLRIPQFGVLSTLNRSYGTRVSVRCVDTCYKPTYHVTVTCQQSGHWSVPHLPRCILKSCLPLPLPNHMMYKEDGGSLCGSVTSYQCKPGYQLTRGNLSRTCLASGLWSGVEPRCEAIKCNLTLDDYVDVLSSSPEPSFNEKIIVSCKEGYIRVSGSKTRRCQHNGTWSGQPLLCSKLGLRQQSASFESKDAMLSKDGRNVRVKKKDDMLIGFSVSGWLLFLLTLGLALFLIKKRRETLDPSGYGARLGVNDVKHISPDRQVTMTTQLSSRDSNEPIWT